MSWQASPPPRRPARAARWPPAAPPPPARPPRECASGTGGTWAAGLTGGSASDTLDPHQGLTYLDTARASALYEPLVKLSADARLEYVLAQEITPPQRQPGPVRFSQQLSGEPLVLE